MINSFSVIHTLTLIHADLCVSNEEEMKLVLGAMETVKTYHHLSSNPPTFSVVFNTDERDVIDEDINQALCQLRREGRLPEVWLLCSNVALVDKHKPPNTRIVYLRSLLPDDHSQLVQELERLDRRHNAAGIVTSSVQVAGAAWSIGLRVAMQNMAGMGFTEVPAP